MTWLGCWSHLTFALPLDFPFNETLCVLTVKLAGVTCSLKSLIHMQSKPDMWSFFGWLVYCPSRLWRVEEERTCLELEEKNKQKNHKESTWIHCVKCTVYNVQHNSPMYKSESSAKPACSLCVSEWGVEFWVNKASGKKKKKQTQKTQPQPYPRFIRTVIAKKKSMWTSKLRWGKAVQ